MRCGVALAQLLHRYGVDTIFGIPGVHTLEYYRGFAECGIRSVLTRHEQGAGFMADGYARASGRPGVCCVITGPGVTNVATAMGQAYSDSIPMLVLASVNRTGTLGKGWGDLHETADQRSLVQAVSGFAASAYHPDDVPDLLGRAFSSFATGRPRPAFLQVPIDILDEETAGNWQPIRTVDQPGPIVSSIQAAADCLMRARRPCMIVGGGAVDAAAEISRLAHRIGAPVITTVAGKGIVPASDPLCVGTRLIDRQVQEWLGTRDTVLAIGTELAQTDVYADRLPITGDLIRVDVDPNQLSGQYPATVPVRSDAAAFADVLLAQLDRAGAPDPLYTDGADDACRLHESREGAEPGLRARVIEAIRAALPPEARVYTDMTQLAYTGNSEFAAESPRRWFHPSGYGTLGYALPAAIGGLLADPGTPTYAMIGDAGLLFTVGEMATAAELELPLTMLLWNNDALGQIQGDMVARDIPVTSVLPRNPNYQDLGRAFGWRVAAPRSLGELKETLHRADAELGPLLVEMREKVLAI